LDDWTREKAGKFGVVKIHFDERTPLHEIIRGLGVISSEDASCYAHSHTISLATAYIRDIYDNIRAVDVLPLPCAHSRPETPGNLPDTIRKVRYPLTPVIPQMKRKTKRIAVPASILLNASIDEKI